MKKILVIGLLIVVTFFLFNQNMITWVKATLASSPIPAAQQRLDFFEKLSLEYYGISDYGKELDLVNHAVDITSLSSELTELIIPSLDAVTRLKTRQTLAAIENQPRSRLSRTATYLSGTEERESKTFIHSKSSMLFLVVGFIVISVIVSLLSYLKYRNRTRRSDLLKLADNETIIMDDSILIDFNLTSYEEQRQQLNLAFVESVN